MEPTIYKPSIYKGAGIYKNGAAGGGDINNAYETDFKNFNAAEKYDLPNLGWVTKYDDDKTYTLIPGGGINVKATSGNVAATRGIWFLVQNNYHVVFSAKIYAPNSQPNFIFMKDLGIANDNSEHATKQIVYFSTSFSYSLFNGAALNGTSYGFNWFTIPIDRTERHKYEIIYTNEKASIFIDDILYVEVNENFVGSINMFFVDPRTNGQIDCFDFMFEPI